jgi:hypothetical protein
VALPPKNSRLLLRISGCSAYFRIGDYSKVTVLSLWSPVSARHKIF